MLFRSSTYIWVLSKDKPEYRTGKVQLIDASHCCEPRRKNIGTKRNDITDLCRDLIVRAYGEYKDGAVYGNKNGVYCQSKVFGSEEFGYNKIVVERPLRYNYSTAEERIQKLNMPDALDDLRGGTKYDHPYRKWQKALRNIDQSKLFDNEKEFRNAVEAALNARGLSALMSSYEIVMPFCRQEDDTSQIVMKKGKPVPSVAKRDTENVPLVQDIDRYFEREVLPYAPDAWIDKKKTKVGYEIPMTRYFYEYQPPEPVEDIVERITALEADIAASLKALFHEGEM